MDDSHNLLNRDRAAVWHPFTQHGLGRPLLPVAGGKGSTIFDTEGRGYLDMISSWWVNLHGHGRPELARAVAGQIEHLDHVQFAGATHEPAVRLAERLLKKAGLTGSAKVFYSDNGSTAVEAALKIAHQHWVNRGSPRRLFATLRGSYHGDTVGAMSVGRSSGFFDAFHGMMFETISLPVPLIWNGFTNEEGEQAALAEISAMLRNDGASIAGLIVEPLVQGAGGMRFHSPRFLKELCTLFREREIPVIFDEVMTFLGNDFSTALAHGHSYTANPVSCAAALASLDLHEQTDSLKQVKRINARIKHHLESLASNPKVEKARLLGGIAAFDLAGSETSYSASAGRELAAYAQEHGVLLRPLGNVLYLMPPYCTTDEELDTAFAVITDFLK